MRDPQLDRLAEVIVTYCAKVQKDDLVAIRAEPHSMPAVEAIFEAVLRAGGHPSFSARSQNLQELLLRHGSDQQIQHANPFDQHTFSTCDVLIVLTEPLNTKYLSQVNPAKIARAQAARKSGPPSSKQLAAKQSRYVLTEIPSHAAAQNAEMCLTEYADFIYRAGFLHLDDPVAAWQKLHEQHQRAIDYLQTRKTLRFQVPASDRH
jgi:aminopeptidase